jgi:osmotically-inducible protein OsmY
MRSRDAELHRTVLAELEKETGLKDQELGVAVQGGVVTLFGVVETYEQKYVAEQTVARVPEVLAVAVDLHVRPPGAHEITDIDIAHAVAGHLRSRLAGSKGKVWAKVEGGWVTLEGEVELFCQKAMAEEGILDLMGVRGVINWVRVVPPETVEDIRAKTEAALARNLFLKPERSEPKRRRVRGRGRGSPKSPE